MKKLEFQHQVKIAREFLESFQVKLQVKKIKGCAGAAHLDQKEQKITINPMYACNREAFWGTLFHELAHVFCYREGIFPLYHRRGKCATLPKLRRVAFTAERYVDNYGRSLMNMFLPNWSYIAEYEDIEKAKEFLKRYYA